MSKSSLLIYAPVPLHLDDSGYLLEDQACNGLRLWTENFDSVTVMNPLETTPAPASWKPVSVIGPSLDRIRFVPLPTSYRPDVFIKNYRRCKAIIRQEIAKADYLSFSIGGLFGDWGSVACYQAHRMQQPFAVWTDRVESEVTRRTAGSGTRKQRIRAALTHRPMAMLERYLIRRASIGLFHGKETFDTYAPHCRRPFLVHDIHLSKSDHIGESRLATKISNSKSGPIKIGYVGRADPMKGPLEWVSVLAGLKARGVDFQAFWMGDGQEISAMKTKTQELGLGAELQYLGFVKDREAVLDRYRDSDIFMFCHKTPESPRCLIEALVSGTPIVGYDGAFARDLIAANGGGRLVKLGDIEALTDEVARLADNRAELAEMMRNAVRDAAPYDDVSVFKHRSDVIKTHLPRGKGRTP